MTRETDAIRLVRWMAEHPKVQRRVCDNEQETTPEEFIEIMESLEKNEFYEMIYVLLVKNQPNEILGQAISRLLMEKISREWERIGTSQLCRDLKDIIKEEIQLQKNRGTKF